MSEGYKVASELPGRFNKKKSFLFKLNPYELFFWPFFVFVFPSKTLFREISDFLRRHIREEKDKGESGHTTHYTHAGILSTCPLHTNSGCGKERRILIGPW